MSDWMYLGTAILILVLLVVYLGYMARIDRRKLHAQTQKILEANVRGSRVDRELILAVTARILEANPLMGTDFPETKDPSSPAIVLAISLQEGANAQTVFSKLERMIEALDEYDQSHDGAGLKLDADRSEAGSGHLKLVLVPHEGNEVEQLKTVVEILERDANQLPGVVKSEVALAV